MKDHGSGIIRCHCSTAMSRGKNVTVRGSTPQRIKCPGCGKMLRVRLVTKPVNRTPGTTAKAKRKRQTKLGEHVLALETENRELRKKVAELEQRKGHRDGLTFSNVLSPNVNKSRRKESRNG